MFRKSLLLIGVGVLLGLALAVMSAVAWAQEGSSTDTLPYKIVNVEKKSSITRSFIANCPNSTQLCATTETYSFTDKYEWLVIVLNSDELAKAAVVLADEEGKEYRDDSGKREVDTEKGTTELAFKWEKANTSRGFELKVGDDVTLPFFLTTCAAS